MSAPVMPAGQVLPTRWSRPRPAGRLAWHPASHQPLEDRLRRLELEGGRRLVALPAEGLAEREACLGKVVGSADVVPQLYRLVESPARRSDVALCQ